MFLMPPRLLSSFSISRRSCVASFLPRLSSWPLAASSVMIRQPLDRLADRLEIGEHAAEPALVHVGHPAAVGLGLHRLARRALGTHEEHGAAIGDDAFDEVRRLRVQRLRLLEVDDVDSVTFAEDVRGHLRVPEAGLVSEMDTRFQHLSHGHAGHEHISCLGWASATSRAAIPASTVRLSRTPSRPVYSDARVVSLPKKAALYTMNPFSEQRFARHHQIPRRAAENARRRAPGRRGAGHDRAPCGARRDHRGARPPLPRPHRQRAEGDPRQRQLPRLPEDHLHLGEPCRLPRHPQRQAAEGRRHRQHRRHRHQGWLPRRHQPHVLRRQAAGACAAAGGDVLRGHVERNRGGEARAPGSATSATPSSSSSKSREYSVVREYCGHGIGTDLSRGPAGPALRRAGHRLSAQERA